MYIKSSDLFYLKFRSQLKIPILINLKNASNNDVRAEIRTADLAFIFGRL